MTRRILGTQRTEDRGQRTGFPPRCPLSSVLCPLLLAALALPAWAGESAADRGRKALLEKFDHS